MNAPAAPAPAPSPAVAGSAPPAAPPRIKKILISGYRAFPPYKPKSLEIDLGDAGDNLLLHGENGSGKTSLFRALRDLFDTSPDARDYATHQNIFEKGPDDAIAIELTSGSIPDYRWEVGEQHPKVDGKDDYQHFARNGFLLEYRDLLQTNFVHRTGEPNLFDLLINVVLPDLPAPTRPLKELYSSMMSALPPDPTDALAVERANAAAKEFRDALKQNLPELVRNANKLLSKLQPLTKLTLNPPKKITYNRKTRDFNGKTLTLGVKLSGKAVSQPQHFLNESRLTAIALALYLAAARLTRAGRPGIMVLDDVLIGLDLSNRIPLLKLLEDQFADWQILLFTYDHTWFELAHEYTKDVGNWRYKEMFLIEPAHGALGRPELRDGLPSLKRAEAHLSNNDFMAAAVYMRAAFEARIRGVCESKGIPVTYKKRPQDVKAEHLWTAIKKRQADRKELQARESAQSHPDFISELLIQEVDLMRSKILNKLSHSDAPTFERSEIEGARDTLMKLEAQIFPDANK